MAFGRQILVAGYFGVGREMDAYFMTFAIASFIAFTPGAIFQHVAVPRLVQIRERGGESEFEKLAGALITLSLLFSAAIGAAFLLLSPIAVHFFAPGFDAAKKGMVATIAVHFLPWVMIVAPYNVLGSVLKSRKRYFAPLSAELVLTGVSMLAIHLWHDHVKDIALAYFGGHVAACAWLIVFLLRENRIRFGLRVGGIRNVLRNMGELYMSMQVGGLASIVERIFQSYLAVGGIAALSYATQLSNAVSGLLGFKQIYVVPLSGEKDRVLKLERLLTGLMFLTLPITGFIAFYARPIIEFFYRRGRFDDVAVENTAGILAVLAFGIFSATINAPLSRMYQVIDKIRLNTIIQAATILDFLAFGFLFQFVFHLGAVGLALAIVLNSYMIIVIEVVLLRSNGLALDLARMSRILIQAAVSNGAVFFALKWIFGRPKGELTDLLPVGAAWVGMTAVAYLLNWRTLRWAVKA